MTGEAPGCAEARQSCLTAGEVWPAKPCSERCSQDRLRPEPESLTSFGTSWSCRPRPRSRPLPATSRGAAQELLDGAANPAAQLAFAASTLQVLGLLACKDGPAEDKLSRYVESANVALGEIWDGSPVLESAATAMADAMESSDCSCWSQATSSFRRLSNACSYAACEIALQVLRCSSGQESWQKPAKRLEALSAALGKAVEALNFREAGGTARDFAPPPREGERRWRPFAVGSFGQSSFGSLLHCLLIAIPVALWSGQALPKSGSKKAKAGQEDLQACRAALKDFTQTLLRATDLQSDATAAAKKEASELLPRPRQSTVAKSLTGPVLEQFEALRTDAEASILEAQRSQLKSLGDLLGQRSALLKSRGALKT